MNDGIRPQGQSGTPLPYGLLGSRDAIAPMPDSYWHPEAASWMSRVRRNGGEVSSQTMRAMSRFCAAVESAGIRDRFFRLNLFCGNSDGALAAVRTPLYLGPIPTGTQYGNTLDTNFNFVSGDYLESAGLTGTGNNGVAAGNSKHLNTGLLPTAWPSISSFHVSAFVFGVTRALPNQSCPIGIRHNTLPVNRWGFDYRQSGTQFHAGDNLSNLPSMPSVATNQHWVATRSSSAFVEGFINGVSQFTNATDVTATLAPRATPFLVFAQNTDAVAAAFSPARMGGYSLGVSLSAAQAMGFYRAMTNFSADIGRS